MPIMFYHSIMHRLGFFILLNTVTIGSQVTTLLCANFDRQNNDKKGQKKKLSYTERKGSNVSKADLE